MANTNDIKFKLTESGMARAKNMYKTAPTVKTITKQGIIDAGKLLRELRQSQTKQEGNTRPQIHTTETIVTEANNEPLRTLTDMQARDLISKVETVVLPLPPPR